MAKELELLKCVLPNKFVMGCIVTKLPHLWRNFSTYLKHHMHEFFIEITNRFLYVEEKAREKNTSTLVALRDIMVPSGEK
jgi:hypothetical protein